MSYTPWDQMDDSSDDYIEKLKEMGFNEQQIRKAVNDTGASPSQASMELLTEYMFNNPISSSQPSGSYYTPSYESHQDDYYEPEHDIPQSSSAYSQPQGQQRSGRYSAVQIVRPGRNGSFEMDSNELERVFGQVADVPVAVYSLAGAFRKGKSFMLNLFLRYLWFQKKGQSHNWLSNKNEEVRKGFGWRGGHERDTHGVWLWDEPFFIKTPSGEVALFLMDTQGSFDHNTPVQGCSVIFALSTMISSVQIYNVMQQIQEDSLQHLQLFTDYGKAAFKTSKLEGKPFQNLLFLVRDWPDPDVSFGTKGGRSHLNELLTLKMKHKDLESVRENLTNSYEDVSCFLMPYPGQTVAVRGKGQGSSLRLREVDPKFLHHLDELVQHLFSPQTIVTKRFNGNIVNGRDLINFMLAYFKVFKSGSMPKVGTILQASAKAAMITVIQQCKETYSSQMAQVFEQVGFLEGQKLRKRHENNMQLALSQYDSLPKLGDDSFIADYRQNLIDLINQQFAVHEQTNIAQMERMKNQVRDVVAEAEQQYLTSLETFANGEFMDGEEFRRAEDESRKAALALYEQNTRECPPKFVKKYKDKLVELMEQALKRFRDGNNHRRDELRRGIESQKFAALDAYAKGMDEQCRDTFLEDHDFENAHETSQRNALEIFDSSEVGRGTDLRNEERERLLRKIGEEQRKMKQTNDINKKLAHAKTLEAMNQAKNLYNTAMQDAGISEYTEESRLKEAHREGKKQAQAIIMSLAQDNQALAEDCRSQLDEFLDNEFDMIKRRNENLGQKARNGFEKAKNNAYIFYQRGIDEGSQKYEEEQYLKRRHKQLKNEALQDYKRNTDKRPLTDFQEFQRKLDEDIEKHFVAVQERNAENKQRVVEKADKALEDIKEEYLKTMNELCDGRSVEPEELEKFHRKILEMSDAKIHQTIGNEEIADRISKKLHRYADGELPNLKENNMKGASIWIRKVLAALPQALMHGAQMFFNNISHPKRAVMAGFAGVTSLLSGVFSDDKDGKKQDAALDKFAQQKLESLSPSTSVDPKPEKPSSYKTEAPPPYTRQAPRSSKSNTPQQPSSQERKMTPESLD